MPELNFQITGVDGAVRSLTPLLHFKVRISNRPPEERIQSVLLTAQIQIQAPQRGYNAREKEHLVELFGPPEARGQTMRNLLWAHANSTIGAFSGGTEAVLAVPCSSDLNTVATKYFEALEGGEVSLLFLFSGSVFYTAGGRLQVSPISWDQECGYRIPAAAWRTLMERHYPNTVWLSLRRDAFEQLYAYRRRHSLMSWEQTIEQLLPAETETSATGTPAAGREELAV